MVQKLIKLKNKKLNGLDDKNDIKPDKKAPLAKNPTIITCAI